MKVVFWTLSGEAGSTAEVSLCFLRLLLFLSWLSQLLFGCGPEELIFYSRRGNESFPRLGKVAQDGIVNSQEGIYRHVVVLMRACRGQAQRAFGGEKKLWLKNLSLAGCEMKNHKHFLCQTLKHVEALLMHRSPNDGDPANIRSLTERMNNHFHLLMCGDKKLSHIKVKGTEPVKSRAWGRMLGWWF